ncbi:CDP-glycerol:poly(glycerophosphate) glycerophosphotransferase [Isoptericola jiangsuensis]|uniref:CDP-glycerol:poly(Glycerophosphate) glycerophosphotransferase n=1 Tax=Isoptericola jiangsuensis TaxID=548579 RepID=A0A2A9F0I2_9MICO|nr:CDP-glycerol glycerophosphotransferase family protein [Isoptericola jiangsuensis]PFG44062.1 CDP-glycerol:poly(glycerophosphate) glycerophosphotransferase [Isoptericola jiangsuensis]
MPSTSSPAPRPRTGGGTVDRAVRTTATTVLRLGSRAKSALHRAAARGPAVDPPLAEIDPAPVVAYFGDTPVTLYQVRQWLPVLERLSEQLPVVVVARQHDTAEALRRHTSLLVATAVEIDDLLGLYDHLGAKVVIYVNNGMRNFQSLIYQRALHVHVNHGESDKMSMVSNQAKAYDRVVVAGQAAVERHRRVLLGLPDDHLAVCGRPQLDVDPGPALPAPPTGRRTVLYAPTWSGENDANNYTSVDVYGPAIVRAVLARDDLRLVYKPHPRTVSGTDPANRHAHAEIVRLIEAEDVDAGHLAPLDMDPLSVFAGTDLLVTDVSSVGLDFLYLHPGVPMLLTDRRTDRARLLAESPVARAVDVVDDETLGSLPEMLDRNLGTDPWHERRLAARDHYFGFRHGESTRRFVSLIGECADRRDALLDRQQPSA